MVSIDSPCASVLDGMSQTATVCDGFAPARVVQAYVEGELSEGALRTKDPSCDSVAAAQEFRELLCAELAPLDQVTFANSGAEANERALGLALRARKSAGQDRVLAFEGGFHGRTLLTLHATANPSKRVPYELPGYKAYFAPFPVAAPGSDLEVTLSERLRVAIGAGKLEAIFGDEASPSAARATSGPNLEDEAGGPLFASELASLRVVHRELGSGRYFACIVEAMQSEGGDRYATARFFQALRLLTSFHGVPLIFDEVQTGFGLGGPFAWHQRFHLMDAEGRPTTPDAVSFAKRAQLGVCVSRFEDPEPGSVAAASLNRGLIHARIIRDDKGKRAKVIESTVGPRLRRVADAFPALVRNPRGCGFAFAFDLPDPEQLASFLGQRFWRGVVVFGAGDRTVRYRLSNAYDESEIDKLFVAVEDSLRWLQDHPGEGAPTWSEPDPNRLGAVSASDVSKAQNKSTTIEVLEPKAAQSMLEAMVTLESVTYEVARREDPKVLMEQLSDQESVVVCAFEGNLSALLGFAIGVPLERVGDRQGPDRDVFLGKGNTLYTISVTVAAEARGQGLGFDLKKALMEEARTRRNASGEQRFRFVTGRTRVGEADTMWRLNRRLGASVLFELERQYGLEEGKAIYYRQALGPVALSDSKRTLETAEANWELSSGIRRPLSEVPATLQREANAGTLQGPIVTKLTICNYVTPSIVRAVEWASALTPDLPHLYLTSSRDECFDKALRVCKTTRQEATTLLVFEGSFFGTTTAAARSASDPKVLKEPAPYFRWPRLTHPEQSDATAFEAQLREAIATAGGSDSILGIFFEYVGERTGLVMPDWSLKILTKIRAEHRVPLVCFETASACYRSGTGPFASSDNFSPDILAWWGGAHTGYLHVNERMWVGKPLTLVSTWDGDELSLIREHHQLRAARQLDLATRLQLFDEALGARPQTLSVNGLGFHRILGLGGGPNVERAANALREAGFSVERFPNLGITLSPPLDWDSKHYDRLSNVLGAL